MDYKGGGLLEGMDYKRGGLLEDIDYKGVRTIRGHGL